MPWAQKGNIRGPKGDPGTTSIEGLTDASDFGKVLLSRATAGDVRRDLDVYSKAEAASLLGGTEMGYSERTTNWTTTNTSLYSTAAAAIISGLSVTVVGEGEPVDIEFIANVYHSVATSTVGIWLNSNGQNSQNPGGAVAFVAQGGTAGVNRFVNFKRRVVLPAGVQHTFTVGIYAVNAGTVTVMGGPNYPIALMVTRR